MKTRGAAKEAVRYFGGGYMLLSLTEFLPEYWPYILIVAAILLLLRYTRADKYFD